MTKATNTMRAQWPAGSEPEAEARAALERGDRARVLSILMEAHGAAVYRYCQRMAGAALADDAYQITFVQAYEGLDGFRGASPLRAWLFGIARHRCYDLLRKERRRPTESQDLGAAAHPGSPADARLAARQVLERCLERLKPKIREAVLLRYQEGLSYPEMAEVCGEDVATLQMRVTRALPGLRKCIEAKSRR